MSRPRSVGSKWMRTASITVFALAASTGCRKSLSEGAREAFARKHSCPEDRVIVQQRDDVNPAEIVPGFEGEEPPPEVAADPDRLAKWKQDVEEKRAKAEDAVSSLAVFEVSGCDTSMVMLCNHPRVPHSKGGYSIQPHKVVCQETLASRRAERAEREQEKDARKRDKDERKREKAERKREKKGDGGRENIVVAE
jgi:hypothetical protein